MRARLVWALAHTLDAPDWTRDALHALDRALIARHARATRRHLTRTRHP